MRGVVLGTIITPDVPRSSGARCRPFDAADAAEAPHVMEQRVDERAARVPGAGMDHQAGRLVDHHDVRIVVQDAERQRFGFGNGRRRARNADGDDQRVGDEGTGLGAPAAERGRGRRG
jgi:hypothetical protein